MIYVWSSQRLASVCLVVCMCLWRCDCYVFDLFWCFKWQWCRWWKCCWCELCVVPAAAVDHLARYPIRHYLMICMHQISVYLFSRSPQKTFKNPLVWHTFEGWNFLIKTVFWCLFVPHQVFEGNTRTYIF